MEPKAKRVSMPRIPSLFLLGLGILGSCGFLESPVSTQAIFKFPTSSSQSRPLANWACLNVWGPDGRWNSSVKAMARVDRDYKVTFTVPYLWVGRKYTFRILGFDTSPSNDSNYTCPTASSSTDFTELGILENQLITKDTTQVLITAHSILFDPKVCGTVGKSCYSNNFTSAPTDVKLQDGTAIEYVEGAPGFNFKVWREKGGQRILKATGLWASSNDWQKQLEENGIEVSQSNFTAIEHIRGIAKPVHTFINRENPRKTNHALYYSFSPEQQKLSNTAGLIGTEGIDFLDLWNSGYSGLGSTQSFYEGNHTKCNSMGMRLPTVYEFRVQTNPLLTGLPIEYSPTYSTEQGIDLSQITNLNVTQKVWTATGVLNPISNQEMYDRYVCLSKTPNPQSSPERCLKDEPEFFICVLP